jgi:hypothetical protein
MNKDIIMPQNLKSEASWLAKLFGRDAYITVEEDEKSVTWRRRLPSDGAFSPKWGKNEKPVLRIRPDGTEERLK